MRITERLSVNERRKRIMEILSARRSVTLKELQDEFGCSFRTIRYDITALSTEYPVFTRQGNGGGIYVPDGWYLSKHYLNAEQEELLSKLMNGLAGSDLKTMQSILNEFASPVAQKK